MHNSCSSVTISYTHSSSCAFYIVPIHCLFQPLLKDLFEPDECVNVSIRQASMPTTGLTPGWRWLCLESENVLHQSTNSSPGTTHIRVKTAISLFCFGGFCFWKWSVYLGSLQVQTTCWIIVTEMLSKLCAPSCSSLKLDLFKLKQ